MNSLNSRLKSELHEIYIREIYVAWQGTNRETRRRGEGEKKKKTLLKSVVSRGTPPLARSLSLSLSFLSLDIEVRKHADSFR